MTFIVAPEQSAFISTSSFLTESGYLHEPTNRLKQLEG